MTHFPLSLSPVIIDYKSFNFASFAFHVAVSCPDGNVCLYVAFKTLESRLPAYTIKTHERTRIINKKAKCEFGLTTPKTSYDDDEELCMWPRNVNLLIELKLFFEIKMYQGTKIKKLFCVKLTTDLILPRVAFLKIKF